MIATEKRYQFDAEEWLSQNMHRNYPLADDQIVRSEAGAYLPSSFLVDLSIHTLPGLASDSRTRFYVSEVTSAGGTISVSISYHPANDDDFVCGRVVGIPATLEAGDPIAARTFTVVSARDAIPAAYNLLNTLSGTLIVGTCRDVASDSYTLPYSSARILEACIVQSMAGMYSMSFKALGGDVTTFSTDFTIEAGDGIDFEVRNDTDPDTGETIPVLVVYRVATEAEKNATYTSVRQVLDAVNAELGNPVKSINGVIPDSYGNITLKGDDCMSVTPGSASVTLSNPCAKPCCGDATPSDVAAALQSLEDVKARLLGYFETLSNNVNSLQARLAALISAGN